MEQEDTKGGPLPGDVVDSEGDSGSDSEEEVEPTELELKELDEGLSRVPAPGTVVRAGARVVDLTIDTSLFGDEDFWDLIKSGY